MVIFALILLLPPKIAIMDSLFYDGKYDQLIRYADSVALKDTGIVRIEALKFKAFAYVAMDSTDKAVSVFRELLSENPYFSIDPIYTFPRAYQAFQKAELELGISAVPSIDSIRKLVNFAFDVRRRQRLRLYSLIVPGLGHMKYGEMRRGRFILASFLASATMWGVSNYFYARSKSAYMSARDLDEIESTYRTMDLWYKIRFASFLATLGFYIYAQVSF